MRDSLGDKARLQHIYSAILEIEMYVKSSSYQEFKLNTMMQFACVKQLEIIGEASNNITVQLRKQYSEIKWREIIGLRNILVHEYFGIDTKIIWDIIKNDVVTFKQQIKEIIVKI